MEEEGSIIKVRISRKAFLPAYLMIVVLLALVFYANYTGKEVSINVVRAVIAFSVFLILYTEVHRITSYYEITPNSLIFSTGILRNATRKIDVGSISDADMDQSLMDRILGIGDIHVRLFSAESSLFIKDIAQPSKFVNILIDVMDKNRRGTNAGS